MQIINNKDAIIKEQINLGDIGNLNIDDLFKDNTNNKKMKNNNYPNWLVPLDIAKELKEIGFDEPTLFHYYENDFDVTIETNSYYDEGEAQGYLHFYISAFKEENFNRDKKCISIPTWEQVFEWFREKKIYGNVNQEWEYGRYNSPKRLNYFYVINDCRKKDINKTEAITNSGFNNYEEAREELVKVLIQTYKREQL